MIGEAIALVLTLAPGVEGDRLILFGLNSIVIQWTALLTLAALYQTRHQLNQRSPQGIACTALGVLTLCTWITFLLLWLALRNLMSAPTGGWGSLFFHMTCLALITGLLGLAAFQNHWQNRQLAIQAKQAELESLRARVRPHFLFNALNSAIALARERPRETEQLLMDLSELFRAALGSGELVSIQRELELSRHYLDIEKFRFGQRLQVAWHIPAELPDIQIPALSVQPLVENAIRHGIEPATAGGDISITVTLLAHHLRVEVSNTLPIDGSQPHEGHHVGLAAIRSRLEAHFQAGSLVKTSSRDGRYSASIDIPVS